MNLYQLAVVSAQVFCTLAIASDISAYGITNVSGIIMVGVVSILASKAGE